MNGEFSWPDRPKFTDDLFNRCRAQNDFRPILFEWYKYIGLTSNLTCCISIKSPALRKIEPTHYAILTGLLNRCSRLILANTRLSCTRRYGETTQLIDRCIAETAIKINWLCMKKDQDTFTRYITDGLKKDLELKDLINNNIQARNGQVLQIEEQMLNSIQHCVDLSGLDENQIKKIKKIQDLATIYQELGLNSLHYLVAQKLGSHSIHGTWTDLILNYLEFDENNGFSPRDHEIDTQDVQFINTIYLVVESIRSFLNYIVASPAFITKQLEDLDNILEEIGSIKDIAWENRFKEKE